MGKKSELDAYRAGLKQFYAAHWYNDKAEPQKPKQFSPERRRLSGFDGSGYVDVREYADLKFDYLAAEVEKVRGKTAVTDVLINFEASCGRNECGGDNSISISFWADGSVEDPLWAKKMAIWEEERAEAPKIRQVTTDAHDKKRLSVLRKELETLEKKLEKK